MASPGKILQTSNPKLTETAYKKLDSSTDLRNINLISNMLPPPTMSDGLASPTPSVMYVPFIMEHFQSDGPDIPMTVSRVLGPSPTAGRVTNKQTAPPSLPPQITEVGLKMSRAFAVTPPLPAGMGVLPQGITSTSIMPGGVPLGVPPMNNFATGVSPIGLPSLTSATGLVPATYPTLPPIKSSVPPGYMGAPVTVPRQV